MSNQSQPRAANDDERSAIGEFLARLGYIEGEEIDGAFITVLPHYMTGGPGYAGPLFYVTFDGGAEFTWVLRTINDNHHFEVVSKPEECRV